MFPFWLFIVNMLALLAVNNKICPWPNTIKNSKGICVCKQGYFGNPADPQAGCWKCEPKCANHATCKKSKICECDGGYYGNGFISCQSISTLPIITHFHPQTSISNGRNNITIEYSSKIKPNYTAYARFDDYLVICNVSFSSIHCQLPLVHPGPKKLRISFNGKDWSRGNDTFVFLPYEKAEMNILPTVVLMVSLTFPLIIYYIPCKLRKTMKPRRSSFSTESWTYTETYTDTCTDTSGSTT